MVQIIIDSREKFQEYIYEQLQKLDIEAEIQKLDHGDYYLCQSGVLIERKEVWDLMSSLNAKKDRSSDFPQKLHRMKEISTEAILLVEGVIRFNRESGRLYRQEGRTFIETHQTLSSYHNFLFSLHRKGIIVVHTNSLDETIRWLASVAKYEEKEWHRPLYFDKTTSEAALLSCVQSFPNISTKLAMEIVKRYSLKEVVMKPDVLEEIEEIGEKKVQKIKEFITLKKGGEKKE